MTTTASLMDAIHQYIEKDEVQLPVFSSTASRIQQEMAKSEPNLQTLEDIINSDQTLASQVLKIANSPFYRGLAEVGTVRVAIMRLGMLEIENIVLLATSKKFYVSADEGINKLMKRLWQHAVGSAYGAMWLARRYNFGVEHNQAFLAGLFHDVGKLVVLVVMEKLKRTQPVLKVSDALLLEAMAGLHAEQGAKLLKKWNIPDYFCVVARDHHLQDVDARNLLLVIVRMANLACHKLGIGLTHDPGLMLPGTLEAGLLNLTEIDLAELEIALEDTEALRG